MHAIFCWRLDYAKPELIAACAALAASLIFLPYHHANVAHFRPTPLSQVGSAMVGEDDEGTAALTGIVRDKEQFDLLVAVVRTLIATDQPRDARGVIDGLMKLISSCVSSGAGLNATV